MIEILSVVETLLLFVKLGRNRAVAAGPVSLVSTGPLFPSPSLCGFFFWTRFENLVAKRRKINDRVVPIDSGSYT